MPNNNSPNSDEIYAELGRKIRVVREALGLTQAQLANSINLSRTSVTNIESGRQQILVHTLYEIASALGVELVDLFPDIDTKLTTHETNLALDSQADINEKERKWIQSLVPKGKPRK